MPISEMLAFGKEEDNVEYKAPDLSRIDLTKVFTQAKGIFTEENELEKPTEPVDEELYAISDSLPKKVKELLKKKNEDILSRRSEKEKIKE